MLDTTDKLVAWYKERFKEYGDTAEGMGWSNAPDHYIRIMTAQRLLHALHVPMNSVLDVGCGIGLLPQLWGISYGNYERTIYHGIDPVPEYIKAARDNTHKGRLANPNVMFHETTFQDFASLDTYALTVALGTIAWQPTHVAQAILHRMWELTSYSGAMLFTYINGQPLDRGQVRMLSRVLPNAQQRLEWHGYTKTGEIMMIVTKAPVQEVINRHQEELEDEVARGEHRDDE